MGTVFENKGVVKREISGGSIGPQTNDRPASHIQVTVEPVQDAVHRVSSVYNAEVEGHRLLYDVPLKW